MKMLKDSIKRRMTDSFYYTMNKEQHFYFPHSDADTWSDAQLWRHYLQPDYFAAHMVRTLDKTVEPETIFSAIIPGFRAAAIAWMRLKFLCEILEPTHILKKRNPRWRFTSELLTWTAEEVTERCVTADVCCNIIGIQICELLIALTKGTDATKVKETLATWEPAITSFNTAVQNLRASPLGECQWNLFHPHELMPLPWCAYIVSSHATLIPLLACLNPTLPSE